MPTPLLYISRLSKAFAAPVLKDIELSLAAGEVVALTGENGAGKSTLSKIVAGIIQSDSGEMQLDGTGYAPSSRADAERLGVCMVLQELGLIKSLSIAENLLLGHMPSRAGFIRQAEMQRIAREQLERIGLGTIDVSQPVDLLGIGQQQLVEIARGLMGALRLLILDEPTAMLTSPEIDRLFTQIAQLKAQGVGIIYISHRLDELNRIADRIVVLRDGALVVNRPARELTHDDVVRAMIGHDPHRDENRPRRTAGTELLRIEHFSRGPWVRDVNLSLHAGEIVGLAGLVGSGRTELLRLIFGADSKDTGNLYFDGSSSPTSIRSPMQAVKRGIGLLTEDRKAQGLMLPQSLATNVTIAHLRGLTQYGWINGTQEESAANKWMQRLRIRAHDCNQAVSELSGGNQQKVLLSRWLHRDCRVLLLDEPTRGVDIGARTDIYKELEALTAAGKALLVVSSDLRELMMLCDRIAVMSAGALVRVFEHGEWSEHALLEAAFSAYTQDQSQTSITQNKTVV